MVQNLQRLAAEWIVSLSLAGAWVALILLQLVRGVIARRKAERPAASVSPVHRTVSLAERAEPISGMRMAAMAAAEPSPSRGDTRTMSDNFDVVIIGGGPGGYNAAIRAGQLGLTAACIDKRGSFGGTCLNIGCIPSKALLYASELYEEAGGEKFAKLGIKAQVSLDLPAMMAHKTKVVGELTKGVEFLLQEEQGPKPSSAKRASPAPVRSSSRLRDGTTRTLTTKNIVIATGSDVMPLPGVTIDEEQIVSSTGALSLKNVPKRLLVVGGGYIGLELGSVWRRLGSEVTVVEFLDRITPGLDGEISQAVPAHAPAPGHEVPPVDQSGRRGKEGRRVARQRRSPAPAAQKQVLESRCRARLHRPPSVYGWSRPGRRQA